MIQIKRGGTAAEAPNFKIGLYGPSGAGKTRTAALAYSKSPAGLLAIVSETQAEAIIRTWNPDATVIPVSSGDDLRRAYEFAKRGFDTGFFHEWDPALIMDPANPTAAGRPRGWVKTAEPFTYETVALDSVSDVFRTMKAEVAAESAKKAAEKHLKQRGTLDGFSRETLEIADWETLQTRMLTLLRAFRDLPCNLVAIYAVAETDDDVKGQQIRPYLQGRDLKATAMGLFNAFGYIHRRAATQGEIDAGRPTVIREVLFLADERFSTKPLDGLSNVEPPDFKTWVRKNAEFRAKLGEKRSAALAAQAASAEPAPVAEPAKEAAPAITPTAPAAEPEPVNGKAVKSRKPPKEEAPPVAETVTVIAEPAAETPKAHTVAEVVAAVAASVEAVIITEPAVPAETVAADGDVGVW